MMNIEKTLNALRANRMDAYYVETSKEAKALALSLIPEGATCASGGSVSSAADRWVSDVWKNV